MALVPVPQGERSVGLAGTEHEVAAVGVGIVGEQFDVIDGAAVLAADALVFQRLLDGDGVGGEGVEVVAGDALAVSGDQEEPVAAPGDVAADPADAGHFDADLATVAVGRHVAHADRAVLVEGRLDLADRRLDAVHAGTDPPEVCQRGDQADGAVAAHAEVATVVEEDHSGTGFGIDRCAEQGADQYVAAARLEDAGGAPGVVALAEQAPALGHVALAEIGKAADDQAGGPRRRYANR